jgi:hypothetical protein
MKLSLQDLSKTFTQQLWLDCSSTPDSAFQNVQHQCYSNEAARHNAALNLRCLSAFMNWMRENLELATPIKVWPDEAALASIWEFVNGSALTIGETRLILIPSEAMDTEGFTVAQEWVDIPSWSADYYLPVQVNLDDNWICVWGYTTYQRLKQNGKLDPCYHTYCLDGDWVMGDLDMLWVTHRLDLHAHAAPIATMSLLPSSTAEVLLKQLSQPSAYSPRLEIEFEPWAALIAHDHWRQQLYQLRIQQIQPKSNSIINAGIWLQDRIDQLAQELSWVLLPALATEYGNLRSPSQELTHILTQLKHNHFSVPATARSAYQDFRLGHEQLRLYAVVWSFLSTGREPQWSLLLILTALSSASLPPDIHWSIADQTKILVNQDLTERCDRKCLVAGVSGNWDETFQATISLSNGATLTIPAIGFCPN